MFRAHFHRSARKPVIMIGDAFVYHQAFTKAVGFCKEISKQSWAAFAGETAKE